MRKINKKHLNEIAKSLLFEKQIQPNLTVDDGLTPGLNNRLDMYSRPGPQVDGDKNYHSIADDEDIVELPITADEVMPVLHVEKTPRADIESEGYCPKNVQELMRATQTLIYNYKKDIGDKEIQSIWKFLYKTVGKVK
tara:strand:+ start:705 stop:1118 length:414 start_codon:yes stop_codon:yes gene_type:complete